jgi:large subunit ribosomal protein L13
MEYVIDVKNKKLGRVATEIAAILQGKKSAYFEPRLAGADSVVVENVGELEFSGNKLKQRVYYRHTGYMGHLKSATLEERFQKDPAKVLRSAVEHMLPKNSLKPKRMKRLIIK